MIKGNCDRPILMEEMTGVGIVEGWIVSDSKIKELDLYVDEKCEGHPAYGIERADVFRDFPEIHNSSKSGFRHFLKTTDLQDGRHTIEIRASNISDETIWFKGEVVINNPALNHSDENKVRLFYNCSGGKSNLDNMPVYLFIEPSKLCNIECVMCRPEEQMDKLR